ncbi:MAG: ImmA/IrrE family metallo-endopeptidase [Peptostreptococcaceae bacterium]|nr:ImmA/IrrE family metallo-endopeptidase [Peptostreptococcaceae bacterium]
MKDNIARAVAELIDRYEDRDPFALCAHLDIEILWHPMCEEIKGYFFLHQGVRIIVLNSELDDFMKKMVCAHELGHAILHEHIVDRENFTIDFAVYDVSAKPELQANLFAGELLVDDNDVLELLEVYDNYFDIAGELGVSPELLDFKIRMMQSKGHPLADFVNCRGDFLK